MNRRVPRFKCWRAFKRSRVSHVTVHNYSTVSNRCFITSSLNKQETTTKSSASYSKKLETLPITYSRKRATDMQ